MEVLGGRAAVIVLSSEDEAATFARQLRQAVHYGWTVRDRPPPRLMLDVSDELSRLTRGEPVAGDVLAAMPAPALGWLSVREAAERAGMSPGFVRRGCRASWFEADRGRRGWVIDPQSFGAWLAARARAARAA